MTMTWDDLWAEFMEAEEEATLARERVSNAEERVRQVAEALIFRKTGIKAGVVVEKTIGHSEGSRFVVTSIEPWVNSVVKHINADIEGCKLKKNGTPCQKPGLIGSLDGFKVVEKRHAETGE